ncbi:MAG: hypothetical protein ACKVVT_06390 [Dehalococcoidia bacterium]
MLGVVRAVVVGVVLAGVAVVSSPVSPEAAAFPVRAFAPLARDGVVPPPPPPPPPPVAQPARCVTPRAADQAGFVLSPADGDSVLLNCQVIAYYGYPDVPGLGVLGEADPDVTAARVAAVAAEYDGVNGPRGVVGAYHLIAAVAQASATADGSWLVRMPDETIAAWVEAAHRHDFIVVLDIQMGHSTVDREFAHFLHWAKDPRVHLALDPEWAMPPGVAPGTIIGGMDASAINRAQQLLSELIVANGLSNRLLIVHQFVPEMIRGKAGLGWYPGVDLVIDTDGFGYPRQKIDNYDRYIGLDGAPHGGMKLFYDEDIGLMSPAEVSALVPQPDLVIYQ